MTIRDEPSPAGYLRQPTLHGDTLTFVCDDDLWQVGIEGGVARRLTAGLSEPSTPCASPDGRWIAYIGRDEHHPEVYLMASRGGPARRLTWLGPDTLVRGWTPAGDILIVSTHGQPFFRNHRAYSLSPAGGAPRLLPLGQVNHLAFGPNGARLIGRNTADPARWKRYRGGTAGHFWIDADGSGEFRRMQELPGNLSSPMWIGDRIWFQSDADGVANLFACRPDGSDLRRHTHHQDFYVRHAQTDGQRIVYQCGADLWLFDPAAGDTRRIEIETPSHRTQAARRFVPAGDHLGPVQVHPAGHSVAVETRGKLHTMALWEGAVRRLGAAPDRPGRQRLGQWLADGRSLVAVSDASGEERITVYREIDDALAGGSASGTDAGRSASGSDGGGSASATGTEASGSATARLTNASGTAKAGASGTAKAGATDAGGSSGGGGPDLAGAGRELPWDIGRVIALRAAPRGTAVAFSNHRQQVWIGDVATGTLTLVDQSDFGRSEDLAWSPDGAWLAYSHAASARHVAIKLHQVATGTSCLVTRPEFRDWSPAFDPEGKFLYFLSLRTFDPVYDSVQFEMSFPRAARPYLIALQAGGAPPFEPVTKGLAGSSRPEAGEGSAGPRPPLRVDLDGIADRIAAFPVAESRFGKVLGAAGGRVVWSRLEIVGAHGRGGHKEQPGELEVFDFATGRAEPLGQKADDFELAADGITLVLREGKRMRAIAVDVKKPEAEQRGGGGEPQAPSRQSGWLDVDRIRLAVEPRLEWRQMLREVWRLQRDHFWTADMSGTDWDEVWQRYAPLVERVATRGELSDLIWEMQGELGTSHAYESGGDHRKPPPVALGYLGAETRHVAEDDSYAITRIVEGDTWDASADSPLRAVGVEARVGERILAVDGQRVSRQRPPESFLVHQAGSRVELTLASGDGGGRTIRRVLVRTLADEVPALYREWVERNRRWVHEQSAGRVGYLHLPDMMAAGFAEFHRYFRNECDREALIVDLRYNRGGHVSELLLEKVARRRIGFSQSRWGRPQPYPDEAVAGPVVALVNEHAGSDGDIFAHGFKLMGLGPLVGTRTWGGVIGIWPRHGLADGSTTTQPEYAFWFSDVGWNVENHGTEPQIEVDNAPQDAAAGRDRQLEVALATAQEQIERNGRPPPEPGARPNRARPPWPGG